MRKTIAKPKGDDFQSVQIEFRDGKARQVCLAGSFNDWNPTAMPMLHMSHDRWVKELSLPPGRYEYRFVVDGEWVSDPTGNDYMPNPHGSHNSVLVVEATP